jgi:hypothetical protein
VNHLARPLAVLVTLTAAAPAQADGDDFIGNHHGRIDLVHLDSDVQGRGACVQMKPAIPGKSGWACLWRNNPLYAEMRELIHSAFITGKRCVLYWNAVDNYGHKTIQIVECWRT